MFEDREPCELRTAIGPAYHSYVEMLEQTKPEGCRVAPVRVRFDDGTILLGVAGLEADHAAF